MEVVPVLRMAAVEGSGEEGAPAKAYFAAVVEAGVQRDDRLDVEAIGKQVQLLTRIATTLLPPINRLFAGFLGVLAVMADAGPVGDPIGGVLEELRGAIGIWQDDAQGTVIFVRPFLQHVILALDYRLFVGIGEGGSHHGTLVGIGAARL